MEDTGAQEGVVRPGLSRRETSTTAEAVRSDGVRDP